MTTSLGEHSDEKQKELLEDEAIESSEDNQTPKINIEDGRIVWDQPYECAHF